MKHLENYGVQALSTEELKSTDGGFPFLIILGASLLLASCVPGCAVAKPVFE